MGKRIDALRVAFARPKRTNWKMLYGERQEAWDAHEEQLEKERREYKALAEIYKTELNRVDDLESAMSLESTTMGRSITRLQHERDKYKSAYEKLEDKAKTADPFRPKDGETPEEWLNNTPHPFKSGYLGHAWKCKTCGKGTRDKRHKRHESIVVPAKEASDEALAVVEQLPGWDVSVRTPAERSTDGFYVSGRSLNYKGRNARKRRAFVHVFTCPKITSRRSDDTIIVAGDGEKMTIAGMIWAANMTQMRAIARGHHKYTKLCGCISGEHDDADNSGGQIGSMITTERKEE